MSAPRKRARAAGRAARQDQEAPLAPGFWRGRALEDFSPREWEALCDGCGKCCLLKLENEDTGEVRYTRVACRLFDDESCRCGSYETRTILVRQCMVLTPAVVRENAPWMPETCAYRRVAEGRPLELWHPLISGDPESVHEAGVSVRGATVPEYDVDPEELEQHVLDEDL